MNHQFTRLQQKNNPKPNFQKKLKPLQVREKSAQKFIRELFLTSASTSTHPTFPFPMPRLPNIPFHVQVLNPLNYIHKTI